MRSFNIPVSIEFDNEVTVGLTSVTITATDRPGALSRIARGFLEADVSVHAAKVATFGEKLEDVFFVSHRDGSPVTQTESLQKIEQSITRNLLE